MSLGTSLRPLPRFPWLCPENTLPPLPGASCPHQEGDPRTRGTCAGGGGLFGNHGGCCGLYDNGDNFDGDVSIGPTQDLH